MKVAIIHDDLMRRGGAEQVALAFHQMFPEAPIYTLCYNPALTYPEFKFARIITSHFQKFAKSERVMKLLFYPLGYWCLRMMTVKGYDTVILSSTYASKYIKVSKESRVINYCHNPFRLAWYPESYELYNRSRGLNRLVFNVIINRLKRIDSRFSVKPDVTIVNSELVKQRVKKVYNIDPDMVINPPVQLANFKPIKEKKGHYLVVSRLETYKKVDLVIKAFNLTNRKLVIVGNGSQKLQLKEIANSNIEFKEGLSKEDLSAEYAQAQALIFPQLEDFGITPLEANASGTPVVAYGHGGVKETIVPLPNEGPTGVFFNKQDELSLNAAIDLFESSKSKFTEENMVKNAQRFSVECFSNKIKEILEVS